MARNNPPKQRPLDVTVRMYRQGLGDCFLIKLPGKDGESVFMLIDCGVWDNDAATKRQMKRVVDDIRKTTAGRIDVLVCTHQHWDHNSGFLQHQPIFDSLQVGEVWLAWTENPADPMATELKREFEAKRSKLAKAANRLSERNPKLAMQISELVQLSGTKGVSADPTAAMHWIRERGRRNGASLRFCSPGQILSIPQTSAARVMVLGPPKSRSLLRKNLATKKETEAGDVYHMQFAHSFSDGGFFAAVEHAGKQAQDIDSLPEDTRDAYLQGLPFDVVHQLNTSQVKRHPKIRDSYLPEHQSWRRIDQDWLNTAAHLALWMDSSTNNTSLVLAIELLPSRKVLLFPADAQVGNWKSWSEVRFKKPDHEITIDDILSRTVLYKVGHHGSHNATLKKNGLEKMNHEELVAMIPVNRGSVEKKGWRMPFAPMYCALETATKGRIIRADEGIQPKPRNVPAKVYLDFKRKCSSKPTHLDFRIQG